MTHAPHPVFRIAERLIGDGQPTYFIADIAANHDGDLDRAVRLIELAAEAGADAAKFQHFSAATIVSDRGFRQLGTQQDHQASWQRSVYDVYRDASLDLGWTPHLAAACARCGIHFLTSPYSVELVEAVTPHVPAFKIGSGDITWPGIIDCIAAKGRPVLLASGASEMSEVESAMAVILARTGEACLMQCNTNYTGSLDNLRHVQLNVLRTYAQRWPGLVLGLSDHTPGHATVLGAIALGARVVEKHFTDDRTRSGPDHAFSMSPEDWRDMVLRSRELEAALGDGRKRVEDNERRTVVLQRRALRAARDLPAGTVVAATDFVALRPCPADAIPPSELASVVGRRLLRPLPAEEHLARSDLG